MSEKRKSPKVRMSKRRDRYVIGYLGSGNMVRCREPKPDEFQWSNGGLPMSLTAARRALKTMPCADCAIFELVPREMNRLRDE